PSTGRPAAAPPPASQSGSRPLPPSLRRSVGVPTSGNLTSPTNPGARASLPPRAGRPTPIEPPPLSPEPPEDEPEMQEATMIVQRPAFLDDERPPPDPRQAPRPTATAARPSTKTAALGASASAWLERGRALLTA